MDKVFYALIAILLCAISCLFYAFYAFTTVKVKTIGEHEYIVYNETIMHKLDCKFCVEEK